MNYEIIVETMEDEDLQKQIYEDVLLKIINECLSEVSQNEKSSNIFKSIN
jgi:hypothetical protein